ncbi:MAG: sugar transferase [Opitutales bacterium]|nr:sugar transferase [Opitutales bacterium]
MPAETPHTPSPKSGEVPYWASALLSKEAETWNRRARRKRARWRRVIALSNGLKRVVDVVGSLCAILLLSPVFLFTAWAIKREDGGPILFKQMRVGEQGRLFPMWKFRSMVVNADAIKADLTEANQHGAEGVTFKMKDDPRITRIGKWIRKLSIDEFPQFFNVLRGEMSLVGPRPPVPKEVALYKARHLRRLRAKPGITCLWQIGGRAEIDFEGQVRLDLQYIQSQGFWSDLWILLKTVPAVLLGKGAY